MPIEIKEVFLNSVEPRLKIVSSTEAWMAYHEGTHRIYYLDAGDDEVYEMDGTEPLQTVEKELELADVIFLVPKIDFKTKK